MLLARREFLLIHALRPDYLFTDRSAMIHHTNFTNPVSLNKQCRSASCRASTPTPGSMPHMQALALVFVSIRMRLRE
jgi:hypothetical protein